MENSQSGEIKESRIYLNDEKTEYTFTKFLDTDNNTKLEDGFVYANGTKIYNVYDSLNRLERHVFLPNQSSPLENTTIIYKDNNCDESYINGQITEISCLHPNGERLVLYFTKDYRVLTSLVNTFSQYEIPWTGLKVIGATTVIATTLSAIYTYWDVLKKLFNKKYTSYYSAKPSIDKRKARYDSSISREKRMEFIISDLIPEHRSLFIDFFYDGKNFRIDMPATLKFTNDEITEITKLESTDANLEKQIETNAGNSRTILALTQSRNDVQTQIKKLKFKHAVSQQQNESVMKLIQEKFYLLIELFNSLPKDQRKKLFQMIISYSTELAPVYHQEEQYNEANLSNAISKLMGVHDEIIKELQKSE